jgi:hypothetical protein
MPHNVDWPAPLVWKLLGRNVAAAQCNWQRHGTPISATLVRRAD